MVQNEARPDAEGTETQDDSRRHFLKVVAAFSGVLAAGGVASVLKSITNPQKGASPSGGFPRVKVASLGDLVVGKVIEFNYPLDDEPNILVKLGEMAKGGVGPDSDIVAFSQLCQHLGCTYGFLPRDGSPSCKPSYKAAAPEGYCCCHGSVYDFTNGARVVAGPSPRPQPQVLLEIDSSGDIYAVGMTGPSIFGHNTGSSDVDYDLQGGNPV